MKVQVNNLTYDLSQNDFLASGGEAHIYQKNDLIFKIYNDPTKVIPSGKIGELAELYSLDNIIIPLDLVFKDKPVGYTMSFIDGSESLCKLFTKSYKTRKNISQNMSMNLVRIMQETLKHIHEFLLDSHNDDLLFLQL